MEQEYKELEKDYYDEKGKTYSLTFDKDEETFKFSVDNFQRVNAPTLGKQIIVWDLSTTLEMTCWEHLFAKFYDMNYFVFYATFKQS